MDTIADFLTIIRNGIRMTKPFVMAPFSNMNYQITKILEEEGFVKKIGIINQETFPKKRLQIFLKYVDGESVIHEVTRVSKLGRRFYAGAKEIKPVIGKLGISILTTNRGVLSHKKAQELGIGGEVLCTVW